MSLVVTCYTPTGIAMSADSRTTGVRENHVNPVGAPSGTPPITVQVPWILSDNTRKLFCVQNKYGVGTWGAAFINDLPTGHHFEDFVLTVGKSVFANTESLADSLMAHFVALSPPSDLGFAVAGYDGAEPVAFELNVATKSKKRWNWDSTKKSVSYGTFYGGDWDIVGRLLGGQAIVPWQLLNLQDAVDISRHLIRATIDQMRFEARTPTVGGHIDTIAMTATGADFLVRKEMHAH